jgi:HAD superfamily hydrolase (TIGR01509 family)
MLPEAVIFDMDGLLVDTETPDWETWRDLHAECGLELTLDQYCDNAGMYGSWERMYAELAAHSGRSPEDLHAWRLPRFTEGVEAATTPPTELLHLLETLRAHEIRRGVASSSDRDWVEKLLHGLGIYHEFQAVATGHDVERRKPAPDVYLVAAERLRVEPRRCVALEDSTHGIQAAHAAGLRVIAIPNVVSARQDLSAADARVRHFGEVTLDLLRKLVG